MDALEPEGNPGKLAGSYHNARAMSDTRRRKLLVALAGLAVVVAVGAVILWSQLEPDRITQASFERIRVGMTRADVAAILGPAGDFRTKESIYLEPPTVDRVIHYPPPGHP